MNSMCSHLQINNTPSFLDALTGLNLDVENVREL